MAPVLKTGEAFRVSVGSNPTPSAPSPTKALLTSANAVRQGLGRCGMIQNRTAARKPPPKT
jgi:hypothetical protein